MAGLAGLGPPLHAAAASVAGSAAPLGSQGAAPAPQAVPSSARSGGASTAVRPPVPKVGALLSLPPPLHSCSTTPHPRLPAPNASQRLATAPLQGRGRHKRARRASTHEEDDDDEWSCGSGSQSDLEQEGGSDADDRLVRHACREGRLWRAPGGCAMQGSLPLPDLYPLAPPTLDRPKQEPRSYALRKGQVGRLRQAAAASGAPSR